MRKTTISHLQAMKRDGEKFAVLTAYDASLAHFISEAGIEVQLIGDSLGMTIQGHDSTLPVTMEQMIYHTEAVARGNTYSLVIADMPFASYNYLEQTLDNAGRLMRAGAQMVKLEGGRWLAESFTRLAQAGIPTCAHLGLTPQSVNKFGGYKVQGRDTEHAKTILEDALALQAAGADLLVLECVPVALAEELTARLAIPVIGIGAGKVTDGQVLVINDMLGLTPGKAPKFSRNFLAETDSVQAAIAAYAAAVKDGSFPAAEHSFFL